jgi:thiosulfate/3-mercaptopyruvate sulfurtransferase
MFARKKPVALFGAILVASVVFAGFLRANPAEPWTGKQTVQVADFAKELREERDPYPTVIYVGVKALYEGAHIPGAVFYGPGSTEQGLSELKKFAATLPKNSDVVLYCGCCPLEKCPNLRPAFVALKESGFARLRVLILPTNFNTDWVEKGFPVHIGEKP